MSNAKAMLHAEFCKMTSEERDDFNHLIAAINAMFLAKLTPGQAQVSRAKMMGVTVNESTN